MFSELIESNNQPLLFKDAVKDWPALKWTPQFLSEQIRDTKFRCKINERNDSMVAEKEGMYVLVSLKQYCDWLSGNHGDDDDNPLKHVKPEEHSCYINYKYMSQMFENCPHLLQELQWNRFGLTNRTGKDGTIWIGSAGAYTPCHQDTYGFNLVTQIYGRKRWFLFDPRQTECMFPTRIPYEESSVFSDVNILKPDLKKHRLFKNITPFVVDLVPGDTLYVPRHWWHFVECMESSISVNTWLPIKEDLYSHVSEAVTKFLMSSFCSSIPQIDIDTFLDPNEELAAASTSLKYIEMAVKTIHHQLHRTTETLTTSSNESNIVEMEKDKTVKQTSTDTDSEDLDDNFLKFKHKFKDFKVSKICRECSLLNLLQFQNRSKEGQYSPTRKKRKICQCSEEHESLNTCIESPDLHTKIFCIERLTFQDYLSLVDNAGQATAPNKLNTEVGQEINDFGIENILSSELDLEVSDSSTDSERTSIKSSEESDESRFLHDTINAILQPNVIQQISNNILNKFT